MTYYSPKLTIDDVAAELQRHHQRRAVEIPTVTVLAGPVGLAVQVWKRWAESVQRPVAATTSSRHADILKQSFVELSRKIDLLESVAHYCAKQATRDPEQVHSAFLRKGSHELDLVLGSCGLDLDDGSAGWLCKQIVTVAQHEAGLEAWLGKLTQHVTVRPDLFFSVLQSLVKVVGSARIPAIIVYQWTGEMNVSDLESTASRLVQIATKCPLMPVAIALNAASLSAFLDEAAESRSKAIFREGVVFFEGMTCKAIQRRISAHAQPQENGQSKAEVVAKRLADDGADENLVESFTELICLSQSGSPKLKESDAARSAAERFLWERLESHPITAGLFELNGKLSAPAAFRSVMEVDLLCRELQLAVEIDGYYHFQDDAAYRRDRRKDLDLQKQGYLVVRLLAKDMVARYEEILETIFQSVEFQRNRSICSNRKSI